MFFDCYKSGYFIFMPGPVLHEKNMHALVKNTDSTYLSCMLYLFLKYAATVVFVGRPDVSSATSNCSLSADRPDTPHTVYFLFIKDSWVVCIRIPYRQTQICKGIDYLFHLFVNWNNYTMKNHLWKKWCLVTKGDLNKRNLSSPDSGQTYKGFLVNWPDPLPLSHRLSGRWLSGGYSKLSQ